jgi:hypothetical protein
MKILTTVALLLGTTLCISAAETDRTENSAGLPSLSNYIPLQKNIPSHQCGSAVRSWKATLLQTWLTQSPIVHKVISEKGGIKAICSYKQAKEIEESILARQNQFCEQQLQEQRQEHHRVVQDLRLQHLLAQQREVEQEQRQVDQMRHHQEELQQQRRVQELLRAQVEKHQEELRQQEEEQKRLRAKVQTQKKRLLDKKIEIKEGKKEIKQLPSCIQQHEEQLRTYTPSQDALEGMTKQVLGCNVHQFYNLSDQHEQMIENLQSQLDKLLAHVARGKADGLEETLSSYLMLYTPTALSTLDLNYTFLSSVTPFQEALERLRIILGEISKAYETSEGRSNIKHKTLLNGLIENVLIVSQLIHNNSPAKLPAVHDYEGVMSYLSSYSEGETGIAFQKKGQNGSAGLTALEALIGGFAYGTNHEMYTQQPNLFNFLMQSDLNPGLFAELVNLRENLCRFYIIITPARQSVLNSFPILQNFTAGKVELEERANQLLAQLTAPLEKSLTYKALKENIELWRTNRIFEKIRQFNTSQDFYNYAKLYNQVRQEFDSSLRALNQLSENFLSRESRLAKLVGELSGVSFTFDRSVALKFKDSLANILQAESGESEQPLLIESFSSYFKSPQAFNNFLDTVNRMNTSKMYLNTEKTAAELIIRISDAQTKHQLFVTILHSIREQYDSMPFNDIGHDMGKVNTIQYLCDMINTYDNKTESETYIKMAPRARKDRYHHTLAALQDSDLWTRDKQEWVNFFKEAYNAYVAARDAIIALNLPQADGQGRLLPGFDFNGGGGTDEEVHSRLPPCVPPPPPNIRVVEGWPTFIQSIKKYSQEYPHQKALILELLMMELKNAQLYVDYLALDIPQLKSKLKDHDINI